MDRDEIIILYREPSIDASYQVLVHLAKGFQRRRLKCEKLMDDGRQMEKLTLPLARRAKKQESGENFITVSRQVQIYISRQSTYIVLILQRHV